jgi:hypothetical protein
MWEEIKPEQHTCNNPTPNIHSPHKITLEDYRRPKPPVRLPYIKSGGRHSTTSRCHSPDYELEEKGSRETGIWVRLEER